VVFQSDLSQTTQTLVAAGIGVALAPRFAVDERDESVAIVELAGQLAPVGLGLFWHRDRVLSNATEAFGEFIREHCAQARAVTSASPGG